VYEFVTQRHILGTQQGSFWMKTNEIVHKNHKITHFEWKSDEIMPMFACFCSQLL